MRALLDSPVVRHPARPAGPPLPAVPVALAAAAVLTQVAYPLLDGTALRAATMLGVVLFAAASVGHAAAAYGARAAVAVVGPPGAPASGARRWGSRQACRSAGTPTPDRSAHRCSGVPLLVPLAWTMMAYPVRCCSGRRLAGPGRAAAARRTLTAVLGGATLAAWDLFLDPQMVAAGHWAWAHPRPGLPGVPDVPLTNLGGWLLVGVRDDRRPRPGAPGAPARPRGAAEALPAALLPWTWLGSAPRQPRVLRPPLGGALRRPRARWRLVVPYPCALAVAVAPTTARRAPQVPA